MEIYKINKNKQWKDINSIGFGCGSNNSSDENGNTPTKDEHTNCSPIVLAGHNTMYEIKHRRQ